MQTINVLGHYTTIGATFQNCCYCTVTWVWFCLHKFLLFMRSQPKVIPPACRIMFKALSCPPVHYEVRPDSVWIVTVRRDPRGHWKTCSCYKYAVFSFGQRRCKRFDVFIVFVRIDVLVHLKRAEWYSSYLYHKLIFCAFMYNTLHGSALSVNVSF